MLPVSTRNGGEHYRWGDGCDGWHLLRRDDLSVIQELVPAGASERAHHHERSRQFFYILEGAAAIEMDGRLVRLGPEEGLEVPPGTVHRFVNDSDAPVRFLVISMPKSHGDRVDAR